MKTRFMAVLIVAAAMLGLWTTSAFAQSNFAKVSGTCRDAEGKPIAGATVRFFSAENGRKYELKTNARGEYLSVAIAPGEGYTVTLLVDGKELDHVGNYRPVSGENPPLDFDPKKLQGTSAEQNGYSPEQRKEMEKLSKEHDEAVAKEGNTVKTLNEKLTAANTASQAGDYDTAIATLTEAAQIDASRDLVWYKLGEVYAQSSGKQSDSGEKTKRLESAVSNFQKAIDLKKKDLETVKPAEKAAATKQLAAYYNSLGGAYSKEGNTSAAVESFNQAAETDPSSAGMYYFNQGATMTNGGHVDEAIAAFDKAIAADPNKAAAYYWKGVNMIGKATLKDNKMVAPEGTAEAFNKYLELEPTGTYADASKQMLESIGAAVQTSYGKKTGTPVKVAPKK